MMSWTIASILKTTEEFFKKHNLPSPRLDAEVLLAEVLHKERIFLYVHFDQPLMEDELNAYREMVKKRAKHMPIAYILGKKEFMKLDFFVNESTLIPRGDTEILVEKVNALIKEQKTEGANILDLGTGSGAIILSILHSNKKAQGVAVDISASALEVAKENAKRLGVDSRCSFICSDMFQKLPKDKKFSIIISNPPYIPMEDMETLDIDVKDYEPISALTDYKDGLTFYNLILKEGYDYLICGGVVAFEVGIHQSQKVADLARKYNYTDIEIIKDLAGIERVVVAWKR